AVTLLSKVNGQCLTPELALINSCIDHPNPNGSNTTVESELLVLSSGIAPIPVSEIGFDLPNNNFGSENSDVGVSIVGAPLGCTFSEPNIDAIPGCDNVIPLGPDDIVPANARIVFFTTNTTQTADLNEVDFSNLCPLNEPIYILQNACERTSGAFANGPSAGDPLRTITVISACGLRGFTYNTQLLDPDEGTYYLVGLNEVGNLDCALPVIPETCPVLDTTFYICDPGGTMPTITAVELSSIYPNDVLSVSFHPTPIAAEGNDDRITSYTPTGSAADTIYARIINSTNFCIAIGELVIRYQDTAAETVAPQDPLLGCDPQMTGAGLFNLRLADTEIGGGQPVTYYLDAGATQVIDDPTAFTSGPTTIFARAGILTCQGEVVPVILELDAGPEVTPVSQATACPENQDGEVRLEPMGSGPFTYTWSVDSFAPNAVQANLDAGDYAWTVTDRNGCSAEGMTAVQAGQAPTLACQAVAAVSMPLASDGRIGVSLSDGLAPWQVSFLGADAGAVEVAGAVGELPGLPAGDYAIVAADASGCTTDTCFTSIGLVTPILLDCAVRNNTDGASIPGAITVTLDGGEPPFTIALSGGPGATTLNNQDRGQFLFDNLGVATYSITVTDAAGQMATCTQTIILDNCPLVVSDVQLLVSDCSGTDNSIIRLSIAGNDGSISTSWSGGNNIELFDGLQEAGPLPPGTYFVAVSDQSGCIPVVAGPIEVVNAGPLQIDVDGVLTSNACSDEGSLVVDVSAGGTSPYMIHLETAEGIPLDIQQGAQATFSDLAGGDGSPNYRVFVTDAVGCSSDTSLVAIQALPAPNILLPTVDQQFNPPTCFGGADGMIILSATGGATPYAYRWLDYPDRAAGRVLPPGPVQTDLLAGGYLVEVTEASGCRDTFPITLEEPVRPTIACGVTTPAIGTVPGTARITLEGLHPTFQATYLAPDGAQSSVSDLPTGDTTLQFSLPGAYLITSTDGNGCNADTCSFTIGEVACAVTSSAQISPVDCSGQGRIVVVPSGGVGPYVFTWEEPSFPARDTVVPTVAGDYRLLITDTNGCTLDTSFTVGVLDNAPEFLTDTLAILPSCFG
ncbi:MAG: SprB repeat-containing protein, partial [Bacteroidota bacterium]